MGEKIKIVENGICIDIEQLKKFIIDEWQSGNLYRANCNKKIICKEQRSGGLYRAHYSEAVHGETLYSFILNDIEDFVDELVYETEIKAQKALGLPEGRLGWGLNKYRYPKSDVRSIGFEVVDKLRSGSFTIENLTTDDIPTILEFLDTPPDKALEAWDKWDKYWASLDYPERRRKLLEDESMLQWVQKWVNIMDTDIEVDIEQLKKIIIDEWQSGELYRFHYNQGICGKELQHNILADLKTLVKPIEKKIHEEAVKVSKDLEAEIDWAIKYPRSDIRSIGFEVLEKISFASWDQQFFENLTIDDIPTILEFLDTPPDKTLEAWDKWDKYWASLDYPERRRKLLENVNT